MMKLFLIIGYWIACACCCLLFHAPCYADSQLVPSPRDYQKLKTPQYWIGKNKKAVLGTFHSRDSKSITIVDSKGNKLRFPISSLSEKTRTWFFRAWQFKIMKEAVEEVEKTQSEIRDKTPKPTTTRKESPENKVEKTSSVSLKPGRVAVLDRYCSLDAEGFKLIPAKKSERTKVPNFNQGDYGHKASDCVPNSYAMFIAWWHENGWLQLPGRERNFEKKVDWLHKRLARCMKTRNNSGTSNAMNITGLDRFLREEVMTNTAFTFNRILDYRAESLSKYTKGANATVLFLTLYYDSHNEGGHAVALKSAHPDGTLELNTWGHTFKAKLRKMPGDAVKIPKHYQRYNCSNLTELPRYELVFSSPDSLPEWFRNMGGRMVLDAAQHDHLVVLSPYLPEAMITPEE